MTSGAEIAALVVLPHIEVIATSCILHIHKHDDQHTLRFMDTVKEHFLDFVLYSVACLAKIWLAFLYVKNNVSPYPKYMCALCILLKFIV